LGGGEDAAGHEPVAVSRIRSAARLGVEADLTDLSQRERMLDARFVRDLLRGNDPVVGLERLDPRGVRILGAIIEDVLDLSYCTLPVPVFITHSRLAEVDLDSAETRDLQFDCCVVGRFVGTDCRVRGVLSFDGAEITHSGECDDASLILERARVDGDVFLRVRSCPGQARLVGVDIGGQLWLSDASFTHHGAGTGAALCLDRAVVRGSVLGRRLRCAGQLRAPGARISGELVLSDADLPYEGPEAALQLDAAEIGEVWFSWVGRVPVSVEGASVGVLRDAPDRWAAGSRVDAFRYRAVALDAVWGVGDRIEWLGRCQFSYFAYRHAAAAYLEHGRRRDGERLLIAGRRRRRKLAALPGTRRWQHPARWGSRFGSWLYDALAGYGYRPWRTGLALATLVLAGWSLFTVPAPGLDVMAARTSKGIYHASTEPCGRSDDPVPCFHPVAYTVDRVVPVLAIGQREWQPDVNRPWGGWYQLSVGVLSLGGWTLASIFVLSFAKVRQDN
jgi:hypothetical protein